MDRSMTEEQEDRAKGGDIGIGDGDIAGTNISDQPNAKKRQSDQEPRSDQENPRDGITGGYGTGGTVEPGDDDGR